VSARPIRVILDASAIVAFSRGSIDVGEVIAEVSDESAAAGLPMLCLVEASRAVADTDQLDLLVSHAATALMDAEAANWQALAATYDTVGRLDAASAVLAAVDFDCDILTSQPGLYAGLAGGGPIIPIPPN
jgi:ABC-type Fe2+-enterobactin transport system substrate-binding protein